MIESVVIGRTTSSATKPTLNNGYFDSKVLSRNHAKFYSEQGKVFLLDLGSSNGTFINAKRLSDEGKESAPVEIQDKDVVCFGIDIIEDGKLQYERVQFTVKLNNEPVPVTTLESRGSSLEKAPVTGQKVVKSASIKKDKPDLPAKPDFNKPISNLVEAVQQGVARVQEQTQEIAKIQSQLQSIHEPKSDTKVAELQTLYQLESTAFNKRLSLLEASTFKISSTIDQLSSTLLKENENLKNDQKALQSQLSDIQKSNAELLKKLSDLTLDNENQVKRKVVVDLCSPVMQVGCCRY